MAVTNTPKNAKLDVTTTNTVMYTCPAGTTATILNVIAANVDGSVSVDADLSWTDSSDSGNETWVAKTIPVPADSALNILAAPLVLEAGDTLKGKASVNGDLEYTASIMERVVT